MNYHVEWDDKQFKGALDKLGRKMPEIEDMIVDRLAEGCINQIQYQINMQFNTRSGTFKNSVRKYKPSKGVRYVIPEVVYAAIHERGGHIYPVKAKYLFFKVDGHWVMTKHVYIPPRPYFHPSIEFYLKGEDSRRVMVQTLQQELDKVVV